MLKMVFIVQPFTEFEMALLYRTDVEFYLLNSYLANVENRVSS
jgi:hypothetical protein